VYNINADRVASRVAVELAAEALVMVSDIPGVLHDLRDASSRIPSLTAAEAERAIASGTVTAGMIPKLEEAFAAIRAGVGRVHIVGALGTGDLERELATPGAVGTALFP
jgi:acetylglutamate kinase